MRIVLMLLGALIAAGALVWWVYLNGMAAAWSTSNSKPGIAWFTREALLWFWLPFAVGVGIAFFGWKRS